MTKDAEVLRGVMRLRGFSLMNTLLAEHGENMDTVKLVWRLPPTMFAQCQ